MSAIKTESNICFIGGDERQIHAASALSTMTNLRIIVSGETFLPRHSQSIGPSVVYEENPIKALRASSTAILPLPASIVESTVSFVDVIEEMKQKEGTVIAGKFSPYMLDLMEEENVHYADLLNDESFNIKNAYITAEGAVHLAMNTLDAMLRDTRCIILGFGRIGMALGQLLLSMGCRPTVYARRKEVRVLAREMGLYTMEKIDLNGSDIIFNTVPQRIISNDDLLELSGKRILIELASAPGGFDPDIAIGCSHNVINGRGLPGKYAPISAGKAIAETVFSFLNQIHT